MMRMSDLFRRLDGLRSLGVRRLRRPAFETNDCRRRHPNGKRQVAWVAALLTVATMVGAQPRYRLEFDTDPVVFDTYPPVSNITVSLTRHGRDPGDLSDELIVTLDRLHAQPGANAFDVPSGWTVTFPAHATATAQTNPFIVVRSATPGTALLTASATNYVGDSAWVHVAPQIPLDQDSNADGIPDWWKMHFFGNLTAVGPGPVDGYTDFDGDGLNDYYEYLARTDPTDADDDAPWLDVDGDGLLNIEEQWLGTHPRRWDTDADGIDDFTEAYSDFTDPVNSLEPLVWRSLEFSGTNGIAYFEDVYPETLSSFTASAWVKPVGTNGGVVLQKRTESGHINFEMGLESGNRPYLAYHRLQTTDLLTFIQPGVFLPPGVWSYVTVVRDHSQGQARLLTWNGSNGEWRQHQASAPQPPATGAGTLSLGWSPAGLNGAATGSMLGEINEVRIWSAALNHPVIQDDYNRVFWLDDVLALDHLIAYYRFDDGGPYVENFAYPIRRGDHPRIRFFEGLKHKGSMAGQVAFKESEIEVLTGVDSDGDGIPDWWEELYFDSPTGADADANHDGTGIPNYWQYRLGADPFDAYSLDPDGILDDGEWDSDGDGLTNWEEIFLYGTDPSRADTDDNGVPDWHELVGDPTGTGNPDPQYITHPLFDMAYHHPTLTNQWGQQFTPPRSLDLSVPAAAVGADWVGIAIPRSERFTITPDSAFTWETWIRPVDTNGVILAYRIGERNSMELGLDNGYPYFRIENTGGAVFTVGGNQGVNAIALPTNVWVHLSAIWSPETKTMQLFVNDHKFARAVTLHPILGAGNMYMGGDGNAADERRLAAGLLNEVRIFDYPRDAETIRRERRQLIYPGRHGLLAYYRFDDAGLTIRDYAIREIATTTPSVRLRRPSELDEYRIDSRDYDIGVVWFPGFSEVENPQSPVGVADWVVTDDAMQFQREVATGIWVPDFDDWEREIGGYAGLPDWWRLLWWPGYRPDTMDADWNPTEDPDGDRLNNLYEFLCRTSPIDSDTDDNGVLDNMEDFSGNGLSNFEEQLYGTDPRLIDSDDSGISDFDEIAAGYSPTHPMGRPNVEGLSLDLAAMPDEGAVIPRPDRFDFGLDGWTIELWFRPDQTNLTGELFSIDGLSGDNLALGLDGGAPYGRIEKQNGETIHAGGSAVVAELEIDQWHHLAMIWSPEDNTLRLRRDGLLLIAQRTLDRPFFGIGVARLGRGMTSGFIDELRVWAQTRTPEMIEYWSRHRVPSFATVDKRTFAEALYGHHLIFEDEIYQYGDTLRLYYRFDDGGDFVEDFAHFRNREYWLSAPRTNAYSSPVRGLDDETGDRLPEWWVALYNLNNRREVQSGTGIDVRDDLKDFSRWQFDQIGDPTEGWDLNSFPDAFNPMVPLNVFVWEGEGPSDHPPTPVPHSTPPPMLPGHLARDFIAFGSFGADAGHIEDDRMVFPKSRIFYDSARHAILVKYFYLDIDPVEADFSIVLHNGIVRRLRINGSEYNDVESSTIPVASHLKRGRNQIAMYVEDTGGVTQYQRVQPPGLYEIWYPEVIEGEPTGAWVTDGEIHEFPAVRYEWPLATIKLDTSLVVDGREVIVRGDENQFDPRSVWFGRAQTDTSPLNNIEHLTDRDGRLWTSLNFGIHDDPDGDGLDNWTEFRIGTNPRDWDTDNNGVSDAEEDYSGDGVINIVKFQKGLDPTVRDTDDDGIDDGAELAMGTNPSDALSPVVYRALRLNGDGYLEMPRQRRFSMVDWTIEAWVQPATNSAGGMILERRLGYDVASGRALVNYGMRLDASNYPVAYFTDSDGYPVELRGDQPLAADGDTWTHMAAAYGADDNILRLIINGRRVASKVSDVAPVMSGPGTVRTRSGVDFYGLINELRFWNRVLDRATMDRYFDQVLSGRETHLVAYYRFDDGGQRVQDCLFANRADWLRDWENTALRFGDATIEDLGYDSPVLWVMDSNQDGIPDWWYLQYFPDHDPAGPSLALEDFDGDGMNNYWEYRLGSNPLDAYSLDLAGKLTDGEWDSDRDGLSNWEEVNVYLTDPTVADTADNGWLDGEEALAGYNPVDPLSPLVQRALRVYGDPEAPIQIHERDLDRQDQKAFNLETWTLEAHILLDDYPLNDAAIIRRETALGFVNYEIGITPEGRLYAFFESQSTPPLQARVDVGDAQKLSLDEWYHVAARLREEDNNTRLTLFVNGQPVNSESTSLVPARDITASDYGILKIGAGIEGQLDEVRVWNRGVDDDEIKERAWETLFFQVDGVASLRLSGDGSMVVQDESPVDHLSIWTLSTWIRLDPGSGPGIIVARESGESWGDRYRRVGRYDNIWDADHPYAWLPGESVSDWRPWFWNDWRWWWPYGDDDRFFNYCFGIDNRGRLFGFRDFSYDLENHPDVDRIYARARTVHGLTDLRDGQWHHVTFTYDGENLALYINGNKEAEVGKLPYPPEAVSIRDALQNDGALIVGEGLSANVDETRIFSTALNADQIRAMMHRNADRASPTLVSAFTYDFETGVTVRDWSRRRDRTSEFGLLVNDATIDMENNLPRELMPINMLQRFAHALPGYWPFEDGGRFARNFMMGYYVRPDGPEYSYAPLGGWITNELFAATNNYAWHAPASFVGRDDFETDTNNDGIPDWWYVKHGWDPFGPSIADEDPDGDGIPNYWEYRLESDPRNPYSLDTSGARNDADYDKDGDGLTNWEEIFVYGTDPRLPDTDNNSYDDGLEIRKGENPLDARSPSVTRSLETDGTPGTYVQAPLQQRFVASNFTVMAWVNPNEITGNEEIIVRSVTDGVYNYRLGWWTDPLGSRRLSVEFSSASDHSPGSIVRAWTTNNLPLNAWTHVAGVFDGDANRLKLYVNGRSVREVETDKIPAKGYTLTGTETRVGRNFHGLIDNAIIYNESLTREQIRAVRNEGPLQPARGLLYDGIALHYTFDDDKQDKIVDRSGRGLHGQANNVTHVGVGYHQEAIRLGDEPDSQVIVPHDQRLRLWKLDDKTFSFWWKVNDTGVEIANDMWWGPHQFAGAVPRTHPSLNWGVPTMPLLSRRDGAHNNRGLLLEAEAAGAYRLRLADNLWIRYLAPGGFVPGQWQHVVLTKQGREWALFVNGQELTFETRRQWPPPANVDAHEAPLRLGWDQLLQRGLYGSFDEVRVYDHALDAQMVADLYELNLENDIPETPWPVAYYAFDDGTHTDGASGNPEWQWGQVTDFSGPYDQDWRNEWRNAGTLSGNAEMVVAAPPPGIEAPGVLYVTSPNPDGIYYPGDTVTVHVVFGAVVHTVLGTPQIELEMESTNRFAYYVGPQHPNSATLAFDYVVGWKDWAWDLDYASTNALLPAGGWILGADGRPFNLTLPPPGEYGSLSWFKDLLIDPPEEDPEDMYRIAVRRGISAEWLNQYFEGVTEVLDPDRDYDGDGMTLLEEYIAGTDPLDARSTLSLMPEVDVLAEGFVVRWPARANRRYTVEYASCIAAGDWTSPPQWENLEAQLPVMAIVDDGSLTGGLEGKRYYRVRVRRDTSQ